VFIIGNRFVIFASKSLPKRSIFQVPYRQTFHKAGKASQGQTLELIWPILKLQRERKKKVFEYGSRSNCLVVIKLRLGYTGANFLKVDFDGFVVVVILTNFVDNVRVVFELLEKAFGVVQMDRLQFLD
jgi:hypothetical protein